MGLDLRGGGLHDVLVLVIKPLLAGLVSVAGPHVNLAGDDVNYEIPKTNLGHNFP